MQRYDEAVHTALSDFVSRSDFARSGCIITDLDGTALHEDQGKILIPEPVEFGFRRLHGLGRPFILNSLRFPLSILRTFGREWYTISSSPIPAVTLNGSLLGHVVQDSAGEMLFEELDAFPLSGEEIDRAVDVIEQLVAEDVKEALLFYYPRDWRIGEVIWTPVAERIITVRNKYVSASSVTAVELPKLREQLHAEDVCMMLLLIDLPQDRLMAYQHTNRSSFVTRAGVDKLFGARRMAELLHVELASSVGAGDTDMDRFLSGVGLAVLVGPLPLDYRGILGTVRLKTSMEFGQMLFDLAAMLGNRK